jgi:hypothetical protein
MTIVRYSIAGIAKAYGLSKKRVCRRLCRLKIKPANEDEKFPLYTVEDAKAVGSYCKAKEL